MDISERHTNSKSVEDRIEQLSRLFLVALLLATLAHFI
jgi:hypothetical protein